MAELIISTAKPLKYGIDLLRTHLNPILNVNSDLRIVCKEYLRLQSPVYEAQKCGIEHYMMTTLYGEMHEITQMFAPITFRLGSEMSVNFQNQF